MKALVYLLVGLVFIMLTQCNSEGDNDTKENEAPYEVPEGDFFHQISWIEGNWILENGRNYEKWTRHDNGYSIEGYKIGRKGKEVVQRGVFKQEDGGYYFTISVGHIRNGAPMRYEMTSDGPTELVFENSEYDFPTKLKYTRQTENIINTKVEGTVGDTFRAYSGVMKKR